MERCVAVATPRCSVAGVERSFVVCELPIRCLVGAALDDPPGDHVEANAPAGATVLRQPCACAGDQASSLVPVDRGLAAAVLCGAAGFHFDEHDETTSLGHEVDLDAA